MSIAAVICNTRYGSFPGNSHRPCGLTLPKGRDPSGLPAADKARLPSVGAAAPIRTTSRRSCPLGFSTMQFSADVLLHLLQHALVSRHLHILRR